MSNNNMPNRPHHRLDTSTGWYVFSENQNEIAKHGPDGLIQFRWTANVEDGVWYPKYTISASIDGGVTWVDNSNVWSLYYSGQFGNYHDNNGLVNKAIIHTRELWKSERRRKLDKERRKAFNALSDEDRVRVKQERSEAWTRRKERAAERKAERTARIMNQMLELGPELVRLKEDIDQALSLMAQGGVDRAFPYYHSRRRYLRTAKWTVNDIRRHIEKAHARKNG